MASQPEIFALPAKARPTREIATQLRVLAWDAFDRPERIVQWDALAQWAVEPNPFFESWYLLPALRSYDEKRSVQFLCLEADGQLVGLLPLWRGTGYYGYPVPHIAGWTHPNSFLGTPLVAPGFERAFWRELLGWADRHAGLSLFLHLSRIPLEGPLATALREICMADARQLEVVHREERAMLCSDLSPDDYFADTLGAKKRKELRRQRRRLEEEGRLEVRRRTGEEDIETWIEEFLALEHAGWKGAEGSSLASSPRTETLFREAVRGAAARGKLERLGLRIDGKPVAMLASFVTPPGAFSFKTAFDERFARHSPGVLLQRENLAMLEKPGVAWTDSCASADHPMIDHLWRERRAIGRLSVAIGGSARRRLFAALVGREMRGRV